MHAGGRDKVRTVIHHRLEERFGIRRPVSIADNPQKSSVRPPKPLISRIRRK